MAQNFSQTAVIQYSLDQSVIRRINKEIQQESLNKDSRIILIPPTNDNYHNLRAFYIMKEGQFQLEDEINTSPLIQNVIQIDDAQKTNKKQKYVYTDCILEVNIIIPKNYPISHPRFKFPQQPLHPSFKNEAICCGISCQFKKNWDPTQTIFSGIETYCTNVLSIPSLIKSGYKIDLTRDCNFEIINMINCNKNMFLEKCEKWAVTKGNLLQYIEDAQFCNYLKKNSSNPLVKEVLCKMQQIKDRRTAYQIRMIEKNEQYFQSLSISMIQQIIQRSQNPNLMSLVNQLSKQNQ
ncbi:hypothetical protein ABPG74_006380 [Tetrahymena malaccensis]